MRTMKAALLTLIFLFSTGIATALVSYDGITTTEMDDPTIRDAITMYRDYMSCATIASLQHLRTNTPAEAASVQNYLLMEIVGEIGSDMHKYSRAQRQVALDLFRNIDAYYQQHPWQQQRWNQEVEQNKREWFTRVDGLRQEVLEKDWDDIEDGKLKDDVQIVPIFRYRSFMAEKAIRLLNLFTAQDPAAAEALLEEALDQLLETELDMVEWLREDLVDSSVEETVLHTLYRVDNYYTAFPPAAEALNAEQKTRLEALRGRLRTALEGYRYRGGMQFFGIK